MNFEDSGPRLIASWPVYSTANFYHCLDAGDTIASWDATGDSLEFRSKVDGQVVATEGMPLGVNANNMEWGLPTKVVHLKSPDGWLNYDLRQRKWIEVPKGTRLVARAPSGGVCRLLDDNRNGYLYDMQSKKRLILESTPASGSISWRLHDDDTTIALDDHPGLLQFHVYNHRDGKLVKTFAPFRLVPYCLAALCLMFMLWSALWMRESARLGGWAWLDVLLVVGLPTAFCIWRHLSTGCPWDERRLTWAYILGGIGGVMLLSSAWWCLGRYRWTLRLLPLLATVAAATFTLRVIVGDQPDLYWSRISVLYIALVFWLISLTCARLLGARLIRLNASGVQVGDSGRRA